MAEAVKKKIVATEIPNFEAQRERIDSLYLFSTIRFATITFKRISITYLSLFDVPQSS